MSIRLSRAHKEIYAEELLKTFEFAEKFDIITKGKFIKVARKEKEYYVPSLKIHYKRVNIEFIFNSYEKDANRVNTMDINIFHNGVYIRVYNGSWIFGDILPNITDVILEFIETVYEKVEGAKKYIKKVEENKKNREKEILINTLKTIKLENLY